VLFVTIKLVRYIHCQVNDWSAKSFYVNNARLLLVHYEHFLHNHFINARNPNTTIRPLNPYCNSC
jgi:hypothetical protein